DIRDLNKQIMVLHIGIVLTVYMFTLVPAILLIIKTFVFYFPAASPCLHEPFSVLFRNSDVRNKQELPSFFVLCFLLFSHEIYSSLVVRNIIDPEKPFAFLIFL